MDDRVGGNETLLRKAAAFRRLAGEILDGPFRHSLLLMASDYEGVVASDRAGNGQRPGR